MFQKQQGLWSKGEPANYYFQSMIQWRLIEKDSLVPLAPVR